jgi:hypothetical protein
MPFGGWGAGISGGSTAVTKLTNLYVKDALQRTHHRELAGCS